MLVIPKSVAGDAQNLEGGVSGKRGNEYDAIVAIAIVHFETLKQHVAQAPTQIWLGLA